MIPTVLGKAGRIAQIGIGAMRRGAANVGGLNGYMDEMARGGMSGADQLTERAAYAQSLGRKTEQARAGYGRFGQAADRIGDAIGTAGAKAGGAMMSPAGNMAMSAAFIAPMFMGGGGGQPQESEVGYEQQPTPQQQQAIAQARQQQQQLEMQQSRQQQGYGLSEQDVMKERLRLAREEEKNRRESAIINAQQQMYGGGGY